MVRRERDLSFRWAQEKAFHLVKHLHDALQLLHILQGLRNYLERGYLGMVLIFLLLYIHSSLLCFPSTLSQ